MIDPALTAPCDDPDSLPDRNFSNEDVAKHWGSDRRKLVKCRDKQKALVTVVETERKALTQPQE